MVNVWLPVYVWFRCGVVVILEFLLKTRKVGIVYLVSWAKVRVVKIV